MNRALARGWLWGVLALVSQGTMAAPVTYEFTGTVQDELRILDPGATDVPLALDRVFDLGTPVSGHFVVDSEVQASSSSVSTLGDRQRASYYFTNALPGVGVLDLTVGDVSYVAQRLTLSVFNYGPGVGYDAVKLSAGGFTVDGQEVADQSIQLDLQVNRSGVSVLNDAGVPDQAAFQAFLTQGVRIGGIHDSLGYSTLNFTVDTISSVPEPATGALMLLGLVGVTMVKRERRHTPA